MPTDEVNLDDIEAVLDRIRPALALDRGEVRVVRFAWPDLDLELVGSCRTCSSRPMTFRYGIADELRRLIPGLRRITAGRDVDMPDVRFGIAASGPTGLAPVSGNRQTTTTSVWLRSKRVED